MKPAVIVLVAIFFFLLIPASVQAASIELTPVSGDYAVNDTISVTITVNTGSKDTTSADAVITYDVALLGTPTVTDGTFYPTVQKSQQSGSVMISGLVTNPGDVVNGTGTLATLQFPALTAGTAQVTISCTSGATDDSNVSQSDVDSTDILDCAQIINASYTIGGSATSTITPTIAAGSTGTTPTAIPNTGFFDAYQLTPTILVGVLLIIVGLIPVFL
ncbi:MAG: cohesin domain-containing protein [Candidatus Roizmanbacteria bacterium]|nr:cohesin domain-containing protein [Candidatus Roizmanbacteria bacterium]